jgi:hypothetical protein
MAGKSAGGEPIPVVGPPPEGMQQGAKRERGIGDAAGYKDVGALIERLRDRLRAEINICRNNLASLRKAGAADFAGGEIGRRKAGCYVVALDDGYPRRAQAKGSRHLRYAARRRQRIGGAEIADDPDA